MNYTGIILAGGKSSRMGADKGLTKFGDIPLVQYSINQLSSFCNQILISSNNDSYLQFGFPVIRDEFMDKGPSGGLAAALKASTNEWNIILSCDVPFVNKEAIEYLISAINNNLGVVPIFKGKAEPLISIYNKSFQSVLESSILNGSLKMQTIIRSSNITLLDFEPFLTKFPSIFKNFNAPQDLFS